MIYLASPYSGTVSEQQFRFEAVREYAAQLIRAGRTVFSPIVYCHELARVHDFGTDAESWLRFNVGMLRIASQMIVLQLDGWDRSKGVTEEVNLANQLFIPITWVKPAFEDDLA